MLTTKQFFIMKINNYISLSPLFIAIILFFFIADLSQFFLVGTIIAPFLICLYCALLSYDIQAPHLTLITILQCLESFCLYNNPFFPLLYLIPVKYGALFIQKQFYDSFWYLILFLMSCLLANIYIIEMLLRGIIPRQPYTSAQIIATLIVGICFSLTIKHWGMQDNRA